MISNDKKAVIHIAMQQLGLSRAEYQDELEKATGVRSSLSLTDQTFARAMEHFKALGFVGQRSKYFRIIENLPKADRPVMSKINAIRISLEKDWKYIDTIARSVAKVDAVQWAKGEQLHKILQALIIHQKRQGRKP